MMDIYFPLFEYNKNVGKFRPDWKFIYMSYFIIVECDEGRHARHNSIDEMRRMISIYQSIGLPGIFIRINPDIEVIRRGKISYSLNKEVINLRLRNIKKIISQCYDYNPKSMVVIYLWYSKISVVKIFEYKCLSLDIFNNKIKSFTGNIGLRHEQYINWIYGKQYQKK